MSNKYKATIPDKPYFITITCVYWIDLFTRLNHRNTIINSLKYCQEKKGLVIFAYCIMPSHLHLICSADNGKLLSEIIRDFKKHTSKELIDNIKSEIESRRKWLLNMFEKACAHLKREQKYKVWQNGYHAKIIESPKFMYQKLNYIHNNPVAQRIVQKPEDYLFSSARNYADLDYELDVFILPKQLITYS
jgi:REP element-mobilizing transposase RayT